MLKTFAASLSVLAIAALALPAFAQDEVSDAVDQALWCGAAYSAVTQVEGMSQADIDAADAAATTAFTIALTAMDADGIDPAEHDRLVEDYVEMAMDNLTDPDAELRYSDAECTALVSQ